MACLHGNCKSMRNGLDWVLGDGQTGSGWDSQANTANYSLPSCELYPADGTFGSTTLGFGPTEYDGASIRQESISDLDLGSDQCAYSKGADARPDGTNSQLNFPHSEFLTDMEFPEMDCSTIGFETLPALSPSPPGPAPSGLTICACNNAIAGMRLELDGIRKELWNLRQKSDRRSEFDKDMKIVAEEVRRANDMTLDNINRLWEGMDNQQEWARSLSYRVQDLENFLANDNENQNEDVDGTLA